MFAPNLHSPGVQYSGGGTLPAPKQIGAFPSTRSLFNLSQTPFGMSLAYAAKMANRQKRSKVALIPRVGK